MRYLALSNVEAVDVCEYPDSGKIGIFANESGTPRLRKLFRAEADVDYYDRESTDMPGGRQR